MCEGGWLAVGEEGSKTQYGSETWPQTLHLWRAVDCFEMFFSCFLFLLFPLLAAARFGEVADVVVVAVVRRRPLNIAFSCTVRREASVCASGAEDSPTHVVAGW